MTIESLAWGYGLIEGPRVDGDGNLYFSDVTKGGVFCRRPDGSIDVIVPNRLDGGGRAARAAASRGEGRPDGRAVDAEGGVWGALYGGGAVQRYLPSGAADARIAVAARGVTSLCFGGDDLRDLYVVTADNTD